MIRIGGNTLLGAFSLSPTLCPLCARPSSLSVCSCGPRQPTTSSLEDELEENESSAIDAKLAHSLSSMATTSLFPGLRVAPAVYMGDTLMLYLKDVHHGGSHKRRDADRSNGGGGREEGEWFNAALWEFLDDFLLWKANSLLVARAPTLEDASYWHY